MRQRRCRHNRRIFDPHAVMNLVAFLQSAQDGNSILDGRLLDQNRLETALQRRVFFDVLAIFIQRCRADTAQFAARQSRFEHIGSIHRPFRSARADHRMNFIDKENNLALGADDFLQHSLESFFELAAIFRAGHQSADVQTDNAFVFQILRHITVNDTLRQTFHNRRLADTRFADQHRIIFGAP